MRRAAVAALHAGYWLLYLLLIALLLLVARLPGRVGWATAGHLVASPIVVLSVVPNVGAFYASYGWLFPRLLARRRLRLLGAGAAAVSVTAAVAGLAVLRVVFGGGQPVFARASETVALALMLSALAGVHVTIALVLRGAVDWYRGLAVREALTRKTHAMELALVRSRLDPHFLFNTLNNLDALIASDAAAASEYLHRLSDIMRFVLYEAKGDAVPLASELDYIDKYIALERLRTRRAAYVTHEVAGSPAGVWIAPMTLLPFVENAFTHGEARKADGAIVSRVTIEGHRVTFECVNHFRPAASGNGQPGGIGHALIHQRLQLLYPDRHVLLAGAEGDRYRVHLTIETADDSLRHR